MPKATHNQTNFTAGEISPRMKGRIDVARYQNGADTIENAFPVVHGGLVRRYGLRYLAAAKLGGARRVRLIRYVFSTQLSFVMEFGHLYVRFFDAPTGAVILNDAGTAPLEIASPYTEDQIFDVTTKQDASAMFLFHPDVPTQRLTRIAPAQWILQDVPWVTEPFSETGHYPDAKLTLSAATVGAGRTFTTSATTAPAAPTIGTAYPLNAQASVNFTPNGTGGGAVSHYTATSNPGGITAQGTSSPILVPGLTNGVAYTFTVTATNALGTSPPSAASNSVTPLSSLGGGTLNVTATPLNFQTNVKNGFVTGIQGPIASTADGTGPYAFAWVKISGSHDIKIVTANEARVVLSSTAYGATTYATLRCTMTDALGAQGSVDVPVAIYHRATYGGGGGGIEP